MSSRSVTREFGHFLVKFEVDDSYYVCPRIKVLTDGSQNRRDLQRGLGKVRRRLRFGRYIGLGGLAWHEKKDVWNRIGLVLTNVTTSSNKQKDVSFELERSFKKQKAEANLLCIQEGTTVSDPYQFLPESPKSPVPPFHLTATSPVQPPPLTQNKRDANAFRFTSFFTEQHAIRYSKTNKRHQHKAGANWQQQQSIDNLTAAVLRHTTTSSVNISPPHTISTPIVRRQELTCTSSNTSRQLQFPDTPSSSNALNTTSSPIVATCSPHPRMDPVRRSLGLLPMHLFTDIDEQYRFPKMT